MSSESHSSNGFSLESFRERAEQVCRSELELNPKNVSALVNLGTLLKVKREHTDAETIFRRALEIDPNSVSALINLGSLMQNVKKDYAEAELLYRRALTINPNDSRALIYLGSVLHFVKGQYSAAEELYRKALDSDPCSGTVQTNMGEHAMRGVDGKLGPNMSAKEKSELQSQQYFALNGHPKEVSSEILPNNTRWSLFENLRIRAETLCRRELQTNPDDAANLINLGTVLKVKGDITEAEKVFRRAVQLSPRSVSALLSLGKFLQKEKSNLGEAEDIFRRAVNINPNEVPALIQLGSLLFNNGRVAEAVEMFRRALDTDPSAIETIQTEINSKKKVNAVEDVADQRGGALGKGVLLSSAVNGELHRSPSERILLGEESEPCSTPSMASCRSANDEQAPPSKGSPVTTFEGLDCVQDLPSHAELTGQVPRTESLLRGNMGRMQSGKFFQIILDAGKAVAENEEAEIPGFLSRFLAKKNWTKRASALVARSKFSYFQTFVPRAAINTLLSSTMLTAQAMTEKDLEAHLKDLVVLMVDISGFTRLSDRFQGLGQEGIDALTTTINNMFSIILDHVESWGGDVVKFAGDAVIVIWEAPSAAAMGQTLVQALECARALERDHGSFEVNVPDVMKLAIADQLNRHFASQAGVVSTNGDVFERKELEALEMRRTLREVSWLRCLTDQEISLLADSCLFVNFQNGEVVMAQGKSSNKLYIIHSGEVKIYLDPSGAAATDAPRAGQRGYGTEISVATEGQILGEISFLTGQPHTATVVAARNCIMVMVTPQALQPILKCNAGLLAELTELMQQHLSSKPKSPGVTLRIHQSLACGRVWLAHIGGEHVLRPHDYGARREFVVVGNALLRAAEALDEAPVGTIVVSKVAWPHIADKYLAHVTRQANYMISAVHPRYEGRPLCPSPGPPPDWDEEVFHVWTQLKLYCHEGARDLQDVAPFAAEVRKMTVLFVRLHLDLENTDRATVEASHHALLTIQNAIYSRNGTLRQFLQDDKGLLAICIMGMPPFTPHENDPTRGVLAAMDIRLGLEALGMKVGIGITTGTAYSGFVGSIKRREMCAMGSMVNMSARLMCKAGEGILVDRNTYDSATLMVHFAEKDPIVVKGRDEPLEVFAPVAARQAHEVKRHMVEFVKQEFGVREVASEVEAYFHELHTMGYECSWMHIRGVCANLTEGNNVCRSADNSTLVAVTDLTGLEHGLTRSQALSRGNFESLKPYPPSHVQMLAKVACLLSHCAFFSLALVRHVYCSTFPNFADLFDESLAQLVELELFQPATVESFAPFFQQNVAQEPLWGWARGELLFAIYAQILGFKTWTCSHLNRDIVFDPAGRGSGDVPTEGDFTPAFRQFVEEVSSESRFHNVYTIPIPGFVETTVTSLLKTYQRIWHRHAAEFFEQQLDQRWKSSHLILAHHWVAAAEYRQTELAYVLSAVQHLQQSAGIAVEQHAYVPAVEMLQRACNMLDLVPPTESTAERKMALLFEMAPHTLVVYGHGSVEAIAAYQGLSRLVPKGATLDDRAVLVMAGTCANLYGKKLFHAGSKLANQIVASAEDPRHVAVGWALLAPALYHNGDIDGVLACLARIHAAHAADSALGLSPPLANGVHITVVALSLWPAALARQGELDAAATRAATALEAAEACGHPPTLCYSLAHLSKDYYMLVGDLDAGESLAARASELAERHQFAHCRRLVAAARRKTMLIRPSGSFSSSRGSNTQNSFSNT